jgi:hypothetical protein
MTTKGIYKRGNIYWIRFTGPDEKIKFETVRSHRKKDAEVLLAKIKNEVQEGRCMSLKGLGQLQSLARRGFHLTYTSFSFNLQASKHNFACDVAA